VIVVDASVVVQTLLGLAGAGAIQDRLQEARGSLHAPHLLEMEVAQVIRRLALRGIIDDARGALALAHLRSFGIQLYPHGYFLQRIWSLRQSISAYASCYVALAETLDAPLLTRDRRLGASQGHAVRIEVFA
jgi:predicted nucleic acid-binding protein